MHGGLALTATIAWLGTFVVLWMRYLAKKGAYLRRFSRIADAPLYSALFPFPYSERWYAVVEATWERQADPELERQRRELWRYSRFGIVLGLMAPLLMLLWNGHLP